MEITKINILALIVVMTIPFIMFAFANHIEMFKKKPKFLASIILVPTLLAAAYLFS